MIPPVRSIPPLDASGVGHGKRSGATAWTGEKRRKTVGAPSPSFGLGSSSSDSDDATEAMLVDDNYRSQVQEEELVFSAEDALDYEEMARCFEVLKSREPCFVSKLDGEGRRKLFEHLARLRYREFKLWKEDDCSLDDTTDTVPVSELPYEVWNWENPLPGGAKFGWTFDHMSFGLAELDDYQRIVLTCAYQDDYPYWDAYHHSIFSSYEADVEYVKYWDELFKKMKWAEEYIHLDRKEFAMYKSKGACQAMKIAASFCHLPASLATRGYNEYINVLEDEFQKGCDRLYVGLWKRVVKQNMNFNEALEDILRSGSLPYKWLHRVNSAIRGYDELLPQFLICKEHIEEYIVDDDDDDDTILKTITDALITKFERPKWYVDYAKKKFEVARRIRVLPGMGRAGDGGSKTAHQ
ncbi:unnamed protein product [Urochloa decumbens]|uniref:Uncharacterized protein n=1 Tax=Urochloa decumbens TaxID=240449 RepID=A0ABC9BEQ7_9POAL